VPSTSSPNKLMGCPFCGCEDIEMVSTNIVCKGCSLVAQFCIVSVDSHARRLWNKRVELSNKHLGNSSFSLYRMREGLKEASNDGETWFPADENISQEFLDTPSKIS
jgi:hypothetical protein